MKLYELHSKSAQIVKINADDATVRRLEEMGLLKGSVITAQTFKKTKITLITLNGWTLAINRRLAEKIEVRV